MRGARAGVLGLVVLGCAGLGIAPPSADAQIIGTTTTTTTSSSSTTTTLVPSSSTSSSSSSSTSTTGASTSSSSSSSSSSTSTTGRPTTTFTLPPTPPTEPEAAPDVRVGSAQMSALFPLLSLLGFAVAIGLATRQWLSTRPPPEG